MAGITTGVKPPREPTRAIVAAQEISTPFNIGKKYSSMLICDDLFNSKKFCSLSLSLSFCFYAQSSWRTCLYCHSNYFHQRHWSTHNNSFAICLLLNVSSSHETNHIHQRGCEKKRLIKYDNNVSHWPQKLNFLPVRCMHCTSVGEQKFHHSATRDRSQRRKNKRATEINQI